MFNRIKSFFKRKQKTFTTTTPSVEISNKNLPESEADLVLDKVKNKEDLTLREINLIMAEKLNVKSIDSNLFKFQEKLIKDAVFVIDTFTVIVDKDHVPKEVKFKLNEIGYGLKLELTVSSLDIHDIFRSIDLTPQQTEGTNHDTKG